MEATFQMSVLCKCRYLLGSAELSPTPLSWGKPELTVHWGRMNKQVDARNQIDGQRIVVTESRLFFKR